MTRRLLLSYLALALLILLMLEIPLAILAQRHERDLSASQAAREAAGVAGLATEDMEHELTGDLQALATTYSASTGGEVAIVGADARVLASSGQDADNDATTIWHGLIRSALAGASANSFSNDEGRPWAAAAAPVTMAPGAAAGAVLLAIPATGTENRIHDIWLGLALFAAGVLVVTGVGGVVLARSLSRPLARLGAAVGELGAGDLAARASEDRGPPQIRMLAREFNHMAGRLSEVVSAQSRFVADASHQLRSPLTALRLRLENLEAESSPQAAEGIAAAGREVQRLSRIVDGLLTLSRAGADEPHRERLDVSSVISERCDAWSALADEKQVRLADLGDTRPPVFALLVPGDLDQILDNLLANALEATPENSLIRVDLEPARDGHASIHVIDEGPGMTAEERERAFDRFWSGTGAGAGRSGLGLAIVEQLAARNGATVELRPADPHGLDAVLTVQVSPTATTARTP
jgi:signal transduction histidine kinase